MHDTERAAGRAGFGSLGAPQVQMGGAEQFNRPLDNSTPRQQGTIEREIDTYSHNLDTLERLLTTLAARVQTVTRNEDDPRTGNGQGKAVTSPASAVAAAIFDKNQRFESLLAALDIITSRIDL